MNSHNQKNLDKIFDHIKKEQIVSSSDIARLLKVSWNTADSYLKELIIEGKIKRIRKGVMTLWMKK